MSAEPLRLSVNRQADAESVRHAARDVAARQGFDRVDAERVVLAASELATNLLKYAVRGEIWLSPAERAGQLGVELVSVDAGPGIPNLEAALSDGFSTGGGLGSGLPSVRRLADEFAVTSSPTGTRIEARVWQTRR